MKRIQTFSNQQLSAIYNRVNVIERLQHLVNTLLPAVFTDQIKVCNYEQRVLSLGCASSEGAAALRFHLPELRDAIRQEANHYPLDHIRIIALPNNSAPVTEAATSRDPADATTALRSSWETTEN